MGENKPVQLKDIPLSHIIVKGDPSIGIDCLNLCNRESKYSSIMTYVTDIRFVKYIENNPNFKAVFITQELFDSLDDSLRDEKVFLITDNPEIEFYNMHQFLWDRTSFYDKRDFKSIIGNDAKISKSAMIDDGVIIGNNVSIDDHTVIKRGTLIGDNVNIGCNCTIGTDGFQIIYDDKKPFCVKHVGGVKIGDDVVIKDNSSISKSLFEGYTQIDNNCMIDSHVHIGHNCVIMKNAVLTAGVTLLGSVTVRNNAWIAPASTIMNRVVIGEHSIVGLGSVVLSDVPDNAKVLGVPARKTQF